MKTKLLLLTALFVSFYSFGQTNGWYLYTKASTIHTIVPDDTNTNELHLATDIGYIKYNTTTNTVTNFLNLTSQNPAIGHVNGLSLNPINTDIALALDNGFAIYNGTTVTIYNYTNSALTVGSVGGSQFTKLEVRYGRQGELYIFKPDVTGYQMFNAGVFDAEVVTAIRPQDIIENQAGTKVFFAGWNDGLHMLEKATTTWTNYTTSNSVLITNVLLSLKVDASDVLYIGGFQGLNTMDSSGVWNTFQQNAPPPNSSFFLPVYDISIDEITGDLLIRTSKPSNSFFGLSMVDLSTNTWTNFTSDNTNCLNANVFTATAFDANGKIYVTPQDNSNPGGFFEFVPGTNTCTPLDINYLNAPTAVNSGLISDFNVRKKTNGNMDIGFTRGENIHMLEINPNTFKGAFPSATTLMPSPGKQLFSLISDNDVFITETNTGWVFVDGSNTVTELNHDLLNHLAIVTKKAAAFDSSDGIVNLVSKRFDAAFNYRVYKAQCNISAPACSLPKEVFPSNRDLTKNIYFNTYQNPTTNIVSVVALKTSKSNVQEWISERYNPMINDTMPVIFEEPVTFPDGFHEKDPLYIEENINPINNPLSAFFSDNFTIQVKSFDGSSSLYTEVSFDGNGDGDVDAVVGSCQIKNSGRTVLFNWDTFDAPPGSVPPQGAYNSNNVNALSNGLYVTAIEIESIDVTGVPTFKTTNILGATIDNALPDDLFIASVKSVQHSPTEMLLMFLTNYGILIKTAIDISSLTLDTNDVSLKDANFLLYPNPANDMVSFSDNTIKSVEVYDINGRKVLSTTRSNSFSVKTLAQGIYIVKGTSDNNVVVTKKLIVE